MLIASGILIVVLMSGIAVMMLYALKVDLRFAREAWQRLTWRQKRLQIVAILCWFIGLAAGSGIGYAVSGSWQGAVAGSVILAVGLAVIGPLVALGVTSRT